MFDRDYAGRLVLGRHGRGASDADVKLFADALADNLMSRYGSSLLDFNSQLKVRVKSETPLRGGAIVKVASEFLRSGGEPIPVDYLMRKNGSNWKVFDVMVEGVSFVQTFRSQFDAPLSRKTIPQVAADLAPASCRPMPAPTEQTAASVRRDGEALVFSRRLAARRCRDAVAAGAGVSSPAPIASTCARSASRQRRPGLACGTGRACRRRHRHRRRARGPACVVRGLPARSRPGLQQLSRYTFAHDAFCRNPLVFCSRDAGADAVARIAPASDSGTAETAAVIVDVAPPLPRNPPRQKIDAAPAAGDPPSPAALEPDDASPAVSSDRAAARTATRRPRATRAPMPNANTTRSTADEIRPGRRRLPTPGGDRRQSTIRGKASTGACTPSTTWSTGSSPAAGQVLHDRACRARCGWASATSSATSASRSPRSTALLQGKPKQAAQAIGRFALNATLGIGGIFDPATDAKLPQQERGLRPDPGRVGLEAIALRRAAAVRAAHRARRVRHGRATRRSRCCARSKRTSCACSCRACSWSTCAPS